MAITAGIFQVDLATGDDALNAGYFDVAGAGAGTDFSIGSPLACTDLEVDATLNTKVKSASIGFTSAHLRNGLRITAGTGFTVGLYEIVSGPDGSGFVTLDRSPGAVGITGGTARVGGPLVSVGGIAAIMGATSGHTAFIKYNASAYQHSSTANVSGGRYNSNGIFLVGYDATRTVWNTDANRPTLNANASAMTLITMGTAGIMGFHNLILDNSGALASVSLASIGVTNVHTIVRRCVFRRSTTTGLTIAAAPAQMADCLFDTCSGTTAMLINGSSVLQRVRVINCSAPNGIQLNATLVVTVLEHVVVSGFTGSNAAVNVSTSGGSVRLGRVTSQCTGATAHAPFFFNLNNTVVDASWCLAVGARGASLGYGFLDNSAANPRIRLFNCAGYDNAQGNVSVPLGDNTGFVALSADPFVDAAGGDLRLNNNAGGGASLRGVGYAFPGASWSTYPDVGGVQHQDVGGVGGGGRSGVAIVGGSIVA